MVTRVVGGTRGPLADTGAGRPSNGNDIHAEI